jgi:hypothetical protein
MKDSVRRLRSIFPGILGCLMMFVNVQAQSSPVETGIRRAFNGYRGGYAQEKLFVHTDKDCYLSREILWFRIFYMDAFYNRPATMSKMAYVEILDRNNRPLLQEKISLKPGESNGSLTIPVNIPTGAYRFRAYTSWMRNFPADDYFEKTIRIVNPRILKTDSVLARSKQYDVQFFPEGGNLVQNIESRVAFRITGSDGRGLNGEGVLLNNRNDTVLRFHPLNKGLGNFTFTPAAGQTYRALLRFSGGGQILKELPASYSNGYVMHVSKNPDSSLVVGIAVSEELEGEDIFLFVHGSHSILPVKKETVSGRRAKFLIAIKDIQEGISQFTLFNKEGRPVCERLYFKYPERNLLISSKTNPVFATRKKVELNLLVTDQSGIPIDADMSLAVYRIDSLSEIDEMDIRNYIYLTSELGPVETPGYYFKDNGKSTHEEMENLMLTHGWRRYIWEDILQKNTWKPEYPPEFDGHIIRGLMTDKRSGVTVPHLNAYLSVPSKRTQFRPSAGDDSGHVKFLLTDFYGSREIIVQTDPQFDSICNLEIKSPFSDSYSGNLLPEFSVSAKDSSSILAQVIDEQVQHIYNGKLINQFIRQIADSTPFYVVPDEKYKLDDYTRFLTMEEVLREYVRSLNVVSKRNKFELKLIDNPHRRYFDGDPLILIDGVPFFDVNELFQQDPKKIRRLDLVNREYALGNQVYDGVINLTTYNGDLNGIRMNTHTIVLDYPGIQEQREFFSPLYESENQINSRMPDFRTLLYWAPTIRSGISGSTSLNFYTSDIPGKYVGIIQGLSETGLSGSQQFFFEVKK